MNILFGYKEFSFFKELLGFTKDILYSYKEFLYEEYFVEK